MSADVLRCQVRVREGDRYTSCDAEAKHFSVIRPQAALGDTNYAFLMCDDHRSASAEEIGLKADDELRDYVRALGAEPAF